MSKRTIKLDLFNISSLDKALNDYGEWYNVFQHRLNSLATKIAKEGVDIIKAKIYSVDAIFTGEMLKSVHIEDRAVGYVAIVVDSEHAAFVEFGTGQLGEDKPYPYKGMLTDMPVDWQYIQGQHIQYADTDLVWGDRVIPQGTYFWFYYKNGQWWLTQGMPSRPFMYRSGLKLQKKVNKYIKEVFK